MFSISAITAADSSSTRHWHWHWHLVQTRQHGGSETPFTSADIVAPPADGWRQVWEAMSEPS
jgi:hypothetical protein